MITNLEKYLTVKEYANLKGVSVQSVYQKVWRGTLEHKKIGSLVLIKV